MRFVALMSQNVKRFEGCDYFWKALHQLMAAKLTSRFRRFSTLLTLLKVENQKLSEAWQQIMTALKITPWNKHLLSTLPLVLSS